MKIFSFSFSLLLLMAAWGCQTVEVKEKTIVERVKDRTFPSVFQAWYSVDMPEKYPTQTEENRLKVSAMHDIMWEEPLSQLGENVDLVLGLIWDHENHGLANSFTKESLERAQNNKKKLLEINPNMVCLLEVRWRDAPMSFLPENSDWWLRDSTNQVVKGWLGGWEPFYMLDYENPEFQDNVARQAKLAVECGVYDGIMLDWSGHLEIVKKVRKAIGPDKLIVVNIHDDIHHGEDFKNYINGSFMELNPIDSTSISNSNRRTWDGIREGLIYFEENFLEPKVNCLEVWGDRKDLSRMRATTTLGLVYSDGYVLYADPNPLPTPDHYHDWYPMWNVELGKPLGKRVERADGAAIRKYEGGTVVYNHYGNAPVTISFEKDVKRVSTGEKGKTFVVNGRDGDIFIP